MQTTDDRSAMELERGSRMQGWRLFLVCFAMLIVSLDQYIVIVALPDIAKALGYSAHTLQLVVSAYVVASSGFLLFGGRATDLLGQRRILSIGLILYAVSSLVGGLAPGPAVQLTARVAQGLGGALVFPATVAVINTSYAAGRERNRALGMWGAAGAAGLVVGVLLGGVLTRFLGWSAVFFVNVPLAVSALVLGLFVIPKDVPRDPVRRFDVAGLTTAMSAVTLAVWALVEGPAVGWSSLQVLVPATLSVVAAAAFVAVERRSPDPLLPGALLRNRFVRLAVAVGFMFTATFGSLLYFLSLYLQNVLRYDALETGTSFIAPTLVVCAASGLAGPVATRIGLRLTCCVALAVGTAGAGLLAHALTAGAHYVDLLPGLVLVSVGDGTMFTAMFIAAATGVESREQGVAAAMISTSSGVGGSVGLALLVALASPPPGTVRGEAFRVATAHGTRNVVLAIAAGIAATLVMTLVGYPRTAERPGRRAVL